VQHKAPDQGPQDLKRVDRLLGLQSRAFERPQRHAPQQLTLTTPFRRIGYRISESSRRQAGTLVREGAHRQRHRPNGFVSGRVDDFELQPRP
jgi:hypothetical protein